MVWLLDSGYGDGRAPCAIASPSRSTVVRSRPERRRGRRGTPSHRALLPFACGDSVRAQSAALRDLRDFCACFVLSCRVFVHSGYQKGPPLFAQQTNTASNSVQWTLQLRVSDARTDSAVSLTLIDVPSFQAIDLPSFQMRRALLAFGSKSASEGTRTSAARHGSVVAAASISQKHRRSVAR